MKLRCLAWGIIAMASGSLALAQPPPELGKKYLDYLGHITYKPLDTNDIVSIKADLTGDQKPEYILSINSVEVDKQWAVYTDLGDKQWKLIGETDFNQLAFKPSAWKKDSTKFGFYTCYFAGAQESHLYFYEVTTNSITMREKRSVYVGDDGDPKDVAEYDQLFLSEDQREAKAVQLAEWKNSAAVIAEAQSHCLGTNIILDETSPRRESDVTRTSLLLRVLLALGITGFGLWLILKRISRR